MFVKQPYLLLLAIAKLTKLTNDGQRVYFSNPLGIANIFTRVTGGNMSQIFGTLGVDGRANLFLLNPQGIKFGTNAQLDIQGSFVASTANSFLFGDGSEFSATNPTAPPLLTMSVTPGVQWGASASSGTITNQGGNLTVGEDLTLSAGNLDLQGQLHAGRDLTLFAQDTVKVRDSITNPFIASAGRNLTIQGNATYILAGDNITDIYSSSGVSTDGSTYEYYFESINGGGDIALTAGGDITIGSINSKSYSGNGGNITLTAGGNITTTDINSSSDVSDGGAIALNEP